jgi:hypothetical protein
MDRASVQTRRGKYDEPEEVYEVVPKYPILSYIDGAEVLPNPGNYLGTYRVAPVLYTVPVIMRISHPSVPKNGDGDVPVRQQTYHPPVPQNDDGDKDDDDDKDAQRLQDGNPSHIPAVPVVIPVSFDDTGATVNSPETSRLAQQGASSNIPTSNPAGEAVSASVAVAANKKLLDLSPGMSSDDKAPTAPQSPTMKTAPSSPTVRRQTQTAPSTATPGVSGAAAEAAPTPTPAAQPVTAVDTHGKLAPLAAEPKLTPVTTAPPSASLGSSAAVATAPTAAAAAQPVVPAAPPRTATPSKSPMQPPPPSSTAQPAGPSSASAPPSVAPSLSAAPGRDAAKMASVPPEPIGAKVSYEISPAKVTSKLRTTDGTKDRFRGFSVARVGKESIILVPPNYTASIFEKNRTPEDDDEEANQKLARVKQVAADISQSEDACTRRLLGDYGRMEKLMTEWCDVKSLAVSTTEMGLTLVSSEVGFVVNTATMKSRDDYIDAFRLWEMVAFIPYVIDRFDVALHSFFDKRLESSRSNTSLDILTAVVSEMLQHEQATENASTPAGKAIYGTSGSRINFYEIYIWFLEMAAENRKVEDSVVDAMNVCIGARAVIQHHRVLDVGYKPPNIPSEKQAKKKWKSHYKENSTFRLPPNKTKVGAYETYIEQTLAAFIAETDKFS